jgi:hypothetical protein
MPQIENDEITDGLLGYYTGGEFEVQLPAQGIVRLGKVRGAFVAEDEACFVFWWMVEGKGPPHSITNWVPIDLESYAISLVLSSAENIGPDPEFGGGDRLRLKCSSAGELVTLNPPNGRKLCPGVVEELQLATV